MAQEKDIKAIRNFLKNAKQSGPSISISEFEDYLQAVEKEAKLEPLSAKILGRDEAIEMFDLRSARSFHIWQLEQDECYDVSDSLIQHLEKIDNVTKGESKTRARMKIDAILIDSIFEEKHFALGVHNHNQHQHSNLPIPAASRPSTPSVTISDDKPVPAPLMLKPEVELHCAVTYKRQRRLLKGVADYTLHYDGNDPYGTNLVIVEAKRQGAAGLAEGQLLAYMGMVHHARKNSGKQNTTVYGVASDGDTFLFYRIGNESHLARSLPLVWEAPLHQKEIVSLLRLSIRAAICSSPSTSPIKEGQAREAMLATFHDPMAQGRFDYGIRETDWEILSDEDMEPEEDN